jgi:hypothetical protein
VANTPHERVAFAMRRDVGRVQLRLMTEPPVFDGPALRVREQLSVKDARDNELRRSENTRTFSWNGSALVADTESLATVMDRP